MTIHDLALILIAATLGGVVVLAAVATEGGDYAPAPVELRWQDYRDHNVEGWERIRDAQEGTR